MGRGGATEVILFLHNRYRFAGGEERVVENLMWLAAEHLGERVELLERDSGGLGRGRAARRLIAGGGDPEAVSAAVRRTDADVVHAHNLLPSLGWRALKAARDAGARTVLHLHNYRLVCAVGTCIDSRGEDCARCRGRNTAPGVGLRCRGSLAEATAYAAALALWQARMIEHADRVVVPSAAALARLRELRAPLPADVAVLPHVVREFAADAAPRPGGYALVVSRLAAEKDVRTAIDACALAGIELVIAGDGPLAAQLRQRAGGGVRFEGRVSDVRLAELRAGARVALCPSLAQETFGLAAVEAQAAGLPVVAARIGAQAELEGGAELVEPGSATAMAAAIGRVLADPEAPSRALAAVRARCAPERVAPQLRAIYGAPRS